MAKIRVYPNTSIASAKASSREAHTATRKAKREARAAAGIVKKKCPLRASRLSARLSLAGRVGFPNVDTPVPVWSIAKFTGGELALLVWPDAASGAPNQKNILTVAWHVR
jgi:hypothetical protein